MFGNRQIEDEDDQHPIGHHQTYTPRYPVFRFHTIIEEEDEEQTNGPSADGNDNLGFSHSEKFRQNVQN